MISGLAELLWEHHPFHSIARLELADLVASRSTLRTVDAAAHPASTGPFLAAESQEEGNDVGPVLHILLQGPAGCGKHGLVQALQTVLKGRTEVRLARSELDASADQGIVVWISRDGLVPKGLPPRTPRVRVRSLSSAEKAKLLDMEIGRVCTSYGIDPSEFGTDPIREILLRGGFPEAGVLGAVRRLHQLCRRRSRELGEGISEPVELSWVRAVLGPDAHPQDPLPARLAPGCVHSPVVSSLGGGIARIEAFASPGKGRLTLTGAGPQAQIASQVARSRCLALAQHLRFQVDSLRDMDWHVHVSGPEGPKDGLSMGWPTLVAMASHLSGVAVDARFAFTGEIGLSGEVRAVGMVEEKFLACEREGFRRLWIPAQNASDLSILEPQALGSCEPTPVVQDMAALHALGLISSRI